MESRPNPSKYRKISSGGDPRVAEYPAGTRAEIPKKRLKARWGSIAVVYSSSGVPHKDITGAPRREPRRPGIRRRALAPICADENARSGCAGEGAELRSAVLFRQTVPFTPR